VEAATGQINLAFKGMSHLLKDCGRSEATIKRESIAIAHELDLAVLLKSPSKKAWESVYGENGWIHWAAMSPYAERKPAERSSNLATDTRGSNVVIFGLRTLDLKAFTVLARTSSRD